MIFVLGIPAKVFARDAWYARQFIYEAFIKYFKAGYHEQGSALIKCRYQHSIRFGLSLDDVAACEIGGLFAILGSTAPTAFWLIHHVFSDPTVLADCRDELSSLVQLQDLTRNGIQEKGNPNEASKRATIDITSVKSKCPILHSTFQEVLRTHHIGVSARIILKDEVILDGKYRLKKGGMVMMPTPVYHSEKDPWGPDVSTFNHKRFIAAADGNIKRKDGEDSGPIAAGGPKDRAAFRPWGGGHVLCPGRHFATTEILAFAALMILRFDLTLADGRPWPTPTIEKSPMTPALPTPDDPIQVRIRAREPRHQWRVELEDSDTLV